MNALLGALMAIVKTIPGTAISEAVDAANRADAAAELAEQHNMGVTVSGTKMVFTSGDGE